MNHISGMRPSQEVRSSASSSHSGGQAAVVGETVLNPDGRPASAAGSTSSNPQSGASTQPHPADASVWRRLFPQSGEAAPAGAHPHAAEECRLGHFAIEERIGSGGMGAVFRALDARLQRVVALKVLSPAQSGDRSAVMRFQNEARAAARLDHENIARVFFIGEDRGLHFIAFEYITGQNLRDIMARTGRFSVDDALNYLLQIAAALRHTAAAGVVHRDIKPSNIIITPAGRAKLVDLGLARKLSSGTAGDLTVVGTTLGTFDYISPEQARDPRNVDVRSDIYSLGCTFYHMLTGGPPYSSGTVVQKLLDHQSGNAPDPRAVNPGVPPALAAICRKMMAGQVKNRYANPEELIRDLALVAANIGLRPAVPDAHIWTRNPSARLSRIRPGFIWAGSAAIVLLLAVLVDQFPFDGQRGTQGQESVDQSIHNPADHGSLPESNGRNQKNVPPDASAPKLAAEIDPAPGGAPAGPSEDGPEQAATGPNATGTAETPGGERRNSTQSPGTDIVDGQLKSPNSHAASNQSATPDPGDPNGDPDEAWNNLVATARVLTTTIEGFSPFWDSMTSIPTQSDASEGSPSPGAAAAQSPGPMAGPPVGSAERFAEMIAPVATRSEGTLILREYDTLAEAIDYAADGDTILLRFDGPLPTGPISEPMEIDDKQLTLAAGTDASGRRYEPVIRLVNDASGMAPARLFVLEGESADVTVRDVQFDVRIDDASGSSETGALFVVHGPGRVALDRVAVTFESRWPGVVFDLRQPSDPAARQKSMMPTGGDPRSYEVAVNDSFVRGACDLVKISQTAAGTISIDNSGFALRQSLLNVTGGINEPDDEDSAKVTLTHVTAVLGNPLLRVDLTGLARYQAPLEITARNNVIATSENAQLVFMNGSDSTSFEDSLTWHGERNIFVGFGVFWSVRRPAGGMGGVFPESFSRWEQYWLDKDSSPRAPEQAIPADNEASQFWDDPGVKSLPPLETRPHDMRLNLYVPILDIQATDSRGLVGVDPDSLPTLTDPNPETPADLTGPAEQIDPAEQTDPDGS